MRRFITKSLELFSYLVIFFMITAAGMSGASQNGIGGFLVGIIGGAIMAIVIFGALFILMDIADNTRRTVELLEQQRRD
ncbi:MAG: hypothetical protein ACR2Q3_17025 [Woeseiaceae bacterium]